MQVLYAIQGTGNGHVARARNIIPILEKHCDLDVALSGNQSQVDLPSAIDYKLEGLTFTFGDRGGIDYLASWKEASLPRFVREVRELPVENYDLVLSDFEPVSAWAAKLRDVRCVSIGHQAAFMSPNVPRPRNRSTSMELLMKYFAPADENVGFHFDRYDTFVHTPVIRDEVRNLEPSDEGHVLVYLPSYTDRSLVEILRQIPEVNWHIFSRHSQRGYEIENIKVRPINNKEYLESLATCTGLLTGGGFEAPAEALYLNKKLLVVPMKGQYEQQCNAEALRLLGVTVIKSMDERHLPQIQDWTKNAQAIGAPIPYLDETEEILMGILDRESNKESYRQISAV